MLYRQVSVPSPKQCAIRMQYTFALCELSRAPWPPVSICFTCVAGYAQQLAYSGVNVTID